MTYDALFQMQRKLLGESRVRDPPSNPNLHPAWHFLPLESLLCHVICPTH